MIAQLSPDLVRELEQAGDRPLPIEDPHTKRLYVLVDTEQYEVLRRPAGKYVEASWSEDKNARRCALIGKKFSKGITADEADELAQLQEELAAHRKENVPLPYDIVDALQEAVNSSSDAPAAPAS